MPRKIRSLAAVAALAPVAAFAAVPEDVSTALTTASTDVATVAGGVLSIVVVIFGFIMMRRALR